MKTIKEPRHSGFPTLEQDIHELCKKYKIKNYTINDNLSIDVDGDVYLTFEDLQFLPINFNYVSGDFDCYNNELVSLRGAPRKVGGSFQCDYNKLVSLKWSPKEINGGFRCSDNNILSLERLPVGIDYEYTITSFKNNPIYSLVNTFIKESNTSELVKEFNEYSIVRGDTVVLNRLKGFVIDLDLEMPNMDEVKKYYNIAYNLI